jgi:hypothetical protein
MTPDDHDKRATLLTAREIATLNRAREVLKRLEDTAWRRSLAQYDPFAEVTAWDLGRLSGAASTADDALFHVLSTARANCGAKISDAQLRGAGRPQDDRSPPAEPSVETAPDEPAAASQLQQADEGRPAQPSRL